MTDAVTTPSAPPTTSKKGWLALVALPRPSS